MIFVNPITNIIKHFRHKTECPYSTEPESKDHIEMKGYFALWADDVEKRVDDNIIDVVVDDIAIECQVSKISLKELIERTKKLNQKGYYVLWVLHPKNYCKIVRDNIVRPTAVEKYLHKNYFGRVYYFKGEIFAAHFDFEYGIGLKKSKRIIRFYKEMHHFFPTFNKKISCDGLKICTCGDDVWWK